MRCSGIPPKVLSRDPAVWSRLKPFFSKNPMACSLVFNTQTNAGSCPMAELSSSSATPRSRARGMTWMVASSKVVGASAGGMRRVMATPTIAPSSSSTQN